MTAVARVCNSPPDHESGLNQLTAECGAPCPRGAATGRPSRAWRSAMKARIIVAAAVAMVLARHSRKGVIAGKARMVVVIVTHPQCGASDQKTNGHHTRTPPAASSRAAVHWVDTGPAVAADRVHKLYPICVRKSRTGLVHWPPTIRHAYRRSILRSATALPPGANKPTDHLQA